MTIREACDAMLARMESGEMSKRGGSTYKPSTVRLYRQTLEAHVYGPMGALPVAKVRRTDIQRLVDALPAGLDGSTVRNVLAPLRVMFREAVKAELIDTSPIHDLDLREKAARRPNVLEGAQVWKVIGAAEPVDRAWFGTMLLAGLRLGEVMALRWRNIDLANGDIHVQDAFDPKAGAFVGPKSKKGYRVVPMIAGLRELLTEHRAACAWGDDPEGLVFGRTATSPRITSTSRRRLKAACEKAGVPTIHHHGGRHTAASVFIRAGVPLEDTSDYLGHASVVITGDIYRHALDEARDEFRERMDGYFARADSTSRLAQLDSDNTE